MEKNKIYTFVIIGVVGVGLFILFINLISHDNNFDGESERSERLLEESTIVREEAIVEDDPAVSEIVEDEIVQEDETITTSGVYDAFVEYLAPQGHRDSIDVTITLVEGVITESSIEYFADNPDSEFYQQSFEENYKDEVIGKKIEDLDLSRVGGASLTTDAFMEALDEIQNQI